MNGTLRFILGDQLSHSLSALEGIEPQHDMVLMVEVRAETRYAPHHKQKLVFVLSAMRHFAAELVARDIRVDYVHLDDPDNTGDFIGELQRAIARHVPSTVVMTEPGEWRVLDLLQRWRDTTGHTMEIRPDTRFLCSREMFARWSRGKKQLRMEYFYREMRRHTGWLMNNGTPEGGEWNYDHDNRKPLSAQANLFPARRFLPDAITRDVIALVNAQFADHFGRTEPFGWATTREDALLALDDFMMNRLACFGDFQDAMSSHDEFLYHSLLSPYLNIGLLTAWEVCEAALERYTARQAPLNAVEGFIRQILGWREYVRGLYWQLMPTYADSNALNANRPLPAFYWSGETSLNCLRQCIRNTHDHAYAHHIQRLMVTGNFALLAGIAPQDVEAWYLGVYIDAFEWVELPNTHGMVLFADDGVMASKPYAASGAYINRMSDYCSGCRYDPAQKHGTEACPFNYLYWDFLARNAPLLGKNPRLGMAYRTLAGFTDERRQQIAGDARQFLDTLTP